MDIRSKILQMFIMGMDGTHAAIAPNLVSALNNGLGGVILFTQNIKSEMQIKTLISEIKQEATISPFVSIDQEGGRVERTENIFGGKKYLSAKHAAEKGENYVELQTEEIAQNLKDLGFNLNFSPVVDVNTNPDNPIIGERAFSNKTDEVIKFGNIAVKAYIKNGIIPCIKHFPGHGDASVDSHISLPKIDMSLRLMEEFHIKPFREIDSPMTMIAHLHCTCFDNEPIPSSISKNVINYLRTNLNYKGLIITDDMVMGGILGINGTEACKKAILAGVDILLYRNSDDKTLEIVNELANLAKSNEELTKRIEKSYERILKFKKMYLK